MTEKAMVTSPKPLKLWRAWELWFVVVAAAAAGVVAYFHPGASAPVPANGLPLKMHSQPRQLPSLTVRDANGKTFDLAAIRGKVVLLNVWATWCPPCRQEMPSLDRLQAQLGSNEFEVLALSVDIGENGARLVRSFYKEIGIQRLAVYQDVQGGAISELKAVGVPTTLLIDRQGREVGRMSGTAEWDNPEIVKALRRIVEETR